MPLFFVDLRGLPDLRNLKNPLVCLRLPAFLKHGRVIRGQQRTPFGFPKKQRAAGGAKRLLLRHGLLKDFSRNRCFVLDSLAGGFASSLKQQHGRVFFRGNGFYPGGHRQVPGRRASC